MIGFFAKKFKENRENRIARHLERSENNQTEKFWDSKSLKMHENNDNTYWQCYRILVESDHENIKPGMTFANMVKSSLTNLREIITEGMK